MATQTQAQQFAAAYSATLAKENLKTLKQNSWASLVIMVIAMVISFTHQRDYLISLGSPKLGAWLLPVAFDAATYVCVRQAGTPAILRRGKRTALVALPFPVGVSMVVNFSAPGALLVKIIFALAVALIAIIELVRGSAGPDFQEMDRMEREVAGTTSVARKACPEDCGCKRHARNRPAPARGPGRPRKPAVNGSGYQPIQAANGEVARVR
jgi:hypothetical protein